MKKNLEQYAVPGHWNDPDMLEVGNGALTVEEERAHFSLWCMLAAPLMAGNAINTMSPATKSILTNREAIAIDQDVLGKQGYKILDEKNFEIFMKPLANGDTVICLFNRSDTKISVTVNWADYKISNIFLIRDLWLHKEVGKTSSIFNATISKHDVVLLRLHKK